MVVSVLRRFWLVSIALAAALALALWATLPTRIGFALWHYNVAFAAIALGAALAWPALRHRRAATLAMAATGALAIATGFPMLYTRQFPYKEWLTWWHSVTSFALMLAFLAHWLHNHTRLWEFTTRLFSRERAPGAVAAAAWVGVVAAGAGTWGAPSLRSLFHDGNYLYLASWAILVGVALTYGAWLAYRLPAMRARLQDTDHRNRLRALVDTSLFLAHWAALLTGFALVWWAEPLRAGDLKYVSKWWHTATSVAFVGLVVLHVGFNARLVAAHARRVESDLSNKP